MKRLMIAILGLLIASTVSASALTKKDIDDVGFHLVAGTPLPPGAVLRDARGQTTLGQVLDGKPALVTFIDYRCEHLCGIILDHLTTILPKLGLDVGRDYRVVAIPLDPAETLKDAAAFAAVHAKGSPLRDDGTFFTTDAASLAALRTSVGLVAPFDPEHHQFAHPAGLVLVDSKGRAERVLSPFALDPLDLKLALTEGGAARGSIASQLLLLCYGWSPVNGLYTLRIERVLMMAGIATVLLIASAIGLFLYRERRLAHKESAP